MTDLDTSEPTDTPTDSEPIHGAVIVLLVGVVFIAGCASMLMSFHGLCDLVQRVEDVKGWLSYVGPVGIDGLQLAALFAIVITSTAPKSVRGYLWTVFLGSIGLSVAGNCVDASARHAGLPGIILSGVWPALLAAATHVVVMAVRWWQSSRREQTPAPTANRLQPSTDTPPAKPADEPTPVAEPVAPKPLSAAQIQSRARTLYTNGRSAAQVSDVMTANGIKVSAKQVERWTKDIREARAQAAQSEPEPEPENIPDPTDDLMEVNA